MYKTVGGERGIAMLGRSSKYRIVAAVALALLASSPANGQGLDQRLAAAEQQLDADAKACRPINVAEYSSLLNEAVLNKQRAEKAAKTGLPIDEAKLNADLAKAAVLLHKAQVALVQECLRRATQPKSHTTGPPTSLDPFSGRILDLHNQERVALGVPPLQWDPALARTATTYAGEMARTGQLTHASRQGRGIVRENINQAFHGSSPDQLMANWLGEKRNFIPGTFPNVSRTGNWYDVGHYSQIIWPTTLYVGCGSARGARWDFFVCRYSPGGNKDGEPVGFTQPSQVATTGSRGLDQRLDAAEQKLDADAKACRPINIADYLKLLTEARVNKWDAERAAEEGFPIDEAKLQADLTKAALLVHKAQLAVAQPCER